VPTRANACLAVLAAAALPWSASAGKQPPPPAGAARADRHGDPLPEGAVARLGTVRLWHGGHVGALALSADGKLLASGSNLRWRHTTAGSWTGDPSDGRVRLWDTTTGKQLRSFRAGPHPVRCLNFSPDGKLLAAACGARVYLWETATGKRLRSPPRHHCAVLSLAFSDRGRLLRSLAFAEGRWFHGESDDTEVCCWDVAAGRRRPRAAAGPPARQRGVKEVLLTAALSPDGRLLLKAFARRSTDPAAPDPAGPVLRVYDADTGLELRHAEPLPFLPDRLALSPDGRRFAAAGGWEHMARGRLCVGDPAGLTPPAAAESKAGEVNGLVFSPDGKTLACHYADAVRLFDAATGKQLKEFSFDRTNRRPMFSEPLPLAFSADGRVLAAADGAFLHLWDLNTGKERPDVPGHLIPVTHVNFYAGGRSVASASATHVCYWDAATGRETGRQSRADQERRPSFLAASPDGRLYVSRAGDGSLLLHDGASGKVLRPLPGTLGTDSWAFFSPDGKALVLAQSAKPNLDVRFCEAASGREWGRVTTGMFYDKLAVSEGGRSAAWMEDGETHLADLAGKSVRRLPGWGRANRWEWFLAFSADGGTLLTLYQLKKDDANPDGEIVVRSFDVASGKQRRQFTILSDADEPAWFSCAALSPDGRTLALALYGEDEVRLWEVAAGRVRARLKGHGATVTSLAFSADGRLLASGSEDGTGLVWDLTAVAAKRPGAP
jgi:WD40 repeat protein